jgi:hypothetical protein
MKIRVGYELIYDCPQPTPMIVTLHIHFTRVSDLIVPDHLITNPSIPIAVYRDAFGNWCSRIVAPKGQLRLSADAVVNDTGEEDIVAASAQQHPVQDLPEETLVFLLWCSSWEADIAKPIGCPRRLGTSSANRPLDGGASRPSAISSIDMSPLVTSTPAPRGQLGRLSMRGPACAVITRTSRLRSVAA